MMIEFIGFDIIESSISNKIKTLIRKAAKVPGLTGYLITVSLVNKDEMLYLQKEYLQKNYLTDVLSFPTAKEEKGFAHSQNMLGDIVICLEKAKEQALENGHLLWEEILVLFIHGFFHLLGHDHEKSEEEAQIQMQGEMWLLDALSLDPALTLIGRVN